MSYKSNSNIYKQAQKFADLTKVLIQVGNLKSASKFLQKAEDYYLSGSIEIKNVISNVFLFSLSSYIELQQRNIIELFPKNLKNEYYNQVNSSGL